MKRRVTPQYTFALAGTPNVGKSTLFNALTGLRQHTGNWIGKTVETAKGVCRRNGEAYRLVDLPGTYALSARSAEERCARDYLRGDEADAVIVVCDESNLRRSLALTLEILHLTPHVCVCLHLRREAEKAGVFVDADALSRLLGVPVARVDARRKTGLDSLLEKAREAAVRAQGPLSADAGTLAEMVTSVRPVPQKRFCADDVLLHRKWGGLVLLLLLSLVLLLTLYGANVPSQWLGHALFALQDVFARALMHLGCPSMLVRMLVYGIYRTLAWVLSVMLPPMAIFFPLFTLLEDCGYLPRAAFRLDCPLHACGACGKQALTMCMGLGCNAAAVTGCRIMDTARERKLAILTNSFMPCNGRFPMLIAVLSVFFSAGRFGMLRVSLLLCGCVLLCIPATFVATAFLSKTALRGETAGFTLELPPFRRPQFAQSFVRAALDRTLKTAARAAAAAAPAGMLIWIAANVRAGSCSIWQHVVSLLDPIGRVMGLDGVILTGFLFAFPANEIVLPAVILGYTAQGMMAGDTSIASLREILLSHGWTTETAVCFLLLALFHAPCATTTLTIKKETGSIRQTMLAVLLPGMCGILLCCAVHGMCSLIHA